MFLISHMHRPYRLERILCDESIFPGRFLTQGISYLQNVSDTSSLCPLVFVSHFLICNPQTPVGFFMFVFLTLSASLHCAYLLFAHIPRLSNDVTQL